jgi:oligopeptide/dipeptide ABC transporter ATP-binding protein
MSSDAGNHYPHEFSGGQRQRIGIARALALRPRFLVADEPVSALDVSIRAQILNLLVDAQRERQLGMLFITHDLGAVRHISSRVAVMYLGAIVEESPTEELFTNARHPYTRALFNAIPQPRTNAHRAKPVAPDTEIPSAVDLPSGCRFRPRCPFAEDICAQSEPPLRPLAGQAGHTTACHFAEALPEFGVTA